MPQNDNDALIAPDYLGVPAEVSTKGSASLPADQPFQPSGAPSTASGAGAAPPSPTSANATLGPRFSLTPTTPTTLGEQPSTGGVVTAGINPASVTLPIPDDVKTAVTALPQEARESLLQQLASMGGKFAQIGNELTKMFPDGGTFDRGDSEQAFQSQRAGERMDFTKIDPVSGLSKVPVGTSFDPSAPPSDLFPSDLLSSDFLRTGFDGADATGLSAADKLAAATAELGETGAEGAAEGFGGSLAGGGAVLFGAKGLLDVWNSRMPEDQKLYESIFQIGKAVSNYYLPVVGGVVADFVHENISNPIVEALFGGFGDSKAWKMFPAEMSQTLALTESSNQQLAVAIANAQSPDEISSAIAQWKSAIGGRVGGFGQGTGAFDIPDVPGATGTKHEGGITVNFNPHTAGLRAMAEVARRGGSLGERIQAFRDAAVGAMSPTERVSADPSGSLLTPEMQAGWKASLIEQTQTTHPQIAQALQTGELTPVQAQGVLDAISPGTQAFATPASPELVAKFAPQGGGPSAEEIARNQMLNDLAYSGTG